MSLVTIVPIVFIWLFIRLIPCVRMNKLDAYFAVDVQLAAGREAHTAAAKYKTSYAADAAVAPSAQRRLFPASLSR